MDSTHSQWLQEQGLHVPIFTDSEGQDRHVTCEGGTWQTLANAIRHAPTLEEFNQRSRNFYNNGVLAADKVWVVPDLVVWYNGSDYDTHGINCFQLGRVKTFTTNGDGTVVKLLKTRPYADASSVVTDWFADQSKDQAPAEDYGPTTGIKSYNLLPVTSALQLHIFPHWRRLKIDVYDPRQEEAQPSFCQLAWDAQVVTRPHDFAPGHYYIWLNSIDFQMAGWLCRGIADVPDDVIESRALQH